jgi:protein-S-isoprenylcysteine O-methyltransferase Ste14
LETTVRIQEDRDHRVIMTGPYRFVRHPMYVGMLIMNLATPLLLGSVWAFVPVAGMVIALTIRTALEDRTLQRELPGYADFCKETKYRLLPPIW